MKLEFCSQRHFLDFLLCEYMPIRVNNELVKLTLIDDQKVGLPVFVHFSNATEKKTNASVLNNEFIIKTKSFGSQKFVTITILPRHR